MKIRWPALRFGPINLWNAPHQPALEDIMTEAAERDAVQDQLCARIDELERDKEVLATQVDRLEEQLAEAKRSKAVMRDTFTTQMQQAVKLARMDWAKKDKADIDQFKAGWQAAALETAVITAQMKGETEVARWLQGLADTFRHQAEGDE